MSKRMKKVGDEPFLVTIVHFLPHGDQHRKRLPATAFCKLAEFVHSGVDLRTRRRSPMPGLR
jgi:hypothetical protein